MLGIFLKNRSAVRLPHCETVYAMTIHKSQGSEFDEVLIALPETINSILTKELLYTALTRAKKTIKFVISETIFKQTIRQKVQRAGGLAEKL
jgi:exodeoxyribonuclease V alpha subunit